MGLIVYQIPDPPKLVRVGYGSPKAPTTEPKKQGRPKMADKKLRDESGTDTIRKDRADEKGAIGSHGENAPAQEKVPEQKGDKDNA